MILLRSLIKTIYVDLKLRCNKLREFSKMLSEDLLSSIVSTTLSVEVSSHVNYALIAKYTVLIEQIYTSNTVCYKCSVSSFKSRLDVILNLSHNTIHECYECRLFIECILKLNKRSSIELIPSCFTKIESLNYARKLLFPHRACTTVFYIACSNISVKISVESTRRIII